eukprot:TRINITY_DN9394_c0_g1_i2.p1 TRINITY_DN9394_c0_g1~~TRINITY_DN9394_c0_g1_i2.p1  ORF type:complete len:306 (+),score=61.90 TRINITY_DN9394_c0_g1_i2:2-919(+)
MAFPARKDSDLPATCHGKLEGHVGAVMSVRFNRDGQYCLTCGKDRMVRLWNPHSQLLIKTYKGHGLEVNDADCATDNGRFISGSTDKSLLLWDVASGKTIRKFRAHSGAVNAVKLNAEATMAVSASYDASVKCWDLRSNDRDPVQVMNEAKDSVPSICLSDHEILAGSVDGFVRCYDMRVGQMRKDAMGDPVTSVTFSHDNNCLLVATLDDCIRLLDKDTGELLGQYQGHKNSEFKVDACLSYNDALVASGSEDGSVFLWDLVDGKKRAELKEHPGVVCSLTFHPKKMCMLSASTDGTVCYFKTA